MEGKYQIVQVDPTKQDKFNFSYLLLLPNHLERDIPIVLDMLNYQGSTTLEDREDKTGNVIQGMRSIGEEKLAEQHRMFPNNPVLLPLIPSEKNEGHVVNGKKKPYYQQLTKECFDPSIPQGAFERIDLQTEEMVKDGIAYVQDKKGVTLADKVVLNVYSSSAQWGQAYSLLHPEQVEMAIIGGAASSIPLPERSCQGVELLYPMGTADLETILDKNMTPEEYETHIENYKKIKFAMYVGENELKETGNYDIKGKRIERDEDGIKLDRSQIDSGMHDISPGNCDTIMVYKQIFGEDLDIRFKGCIQELRKLGVSVQSKIYTNMSHRIEGQHQKNILMELIQDTAQFYHSDGKKGYDQNGATSINNRFQEIRENVYRDMSFCKTKEEYIQKLREHESRLTREKGLEQIIFPTEREYLKNHPEKETEARAKKTFLETLKSQVYSDLERETATQSEEKNIVDRNKEITNNDKTL